MVEKQGQNIVLGKNRGRFKEFAELDGTFHEGMDTLEQAAQTGNKKMIQSLTHKLLDACVVCYGGYKR